MSSEIIFIKGKKVTLRPPETDDIPLFTKWFNDPQTRENLSMRRPITMEEETKIVEKLNSTNSVFLVICEAASGRTIGNLSIDISWINRHGMFGVMLGEKEDQNKGYGREAMTLFIDYCFNVLNLHRIVLEVYSFNERAIHLYKDLGFVHEGTLRQHSYKNGEFYDLFYMGLLDTEYSK